MEETIEDAAGGEEASLDIGSRESDGAACQPRYRTTVDTVTADRTTLELPIGV